MGIDTDEKRGLKLDHFIGPMNADTAQNKFYVSILVKPKILHIQ